MTTAMKVRRALAACALAIAAAGVAAGGAGMQDKPEGKKPDLTVRATPNFGFAPAKVQFSAVLQGGDDDYEQYYCPTVEWDWDDDTVSESTPDCEPYEPGRSKIVRRFSATHTFQYEGLYEVKFKLRRQKKVVLLGTVNITVRPGLD